MRATALTALLVLVAPAAARAEAVPPQRQALILTRALAYDNNLKSRVGESLVVAVVFKPGNSSSEGMADAMAQGFKPLEGVKVQDLPLHLARVPYGGAAALKSAIAAQGIDVLYICDGLGGELAAIKDLTRKQRVLTIGATEEEVRGGLSLGVFVIDAKNTITVNWAASKEEGAAFSSELMRLAKVIR